MKRVGMAGMGLIAGVMAYAALGPVAALVVVWFLLSPDGVAETARAGGAGATVAAVQAGYSTLADEWRRGGPARQRRRSDRRDRWYAAGGVRRKLLSVEHALVLIGRGVTTTIAAAIIGGRAAADAWREARDTVRDRRHPQDDQDDPQPTAVPETETESDSGTPQAGPAVAAPPSDEAPATTDSGSSPAAGEPTPATSTTGENVTTNTTTVSAATELVTADDWEAWAKAMLTKIEHAHGLAGLLQDFREGLPDAYQASIASTGDAPAAGPKTEALTDAVKAISEATTTTEFTEALTQLRKAAAQAGDLGNNLDSLGAVGSGNHTTGFVRN